MFPQMSQRMLQQMSQQNVATTVSANVATTVSANVATNVSAKTMSCNERNRYAPKVSLSYNDGSMMVVGIVLDITLMLEEGSMQDMRMRSEASWNITIRSTLLEDGKFAVQISHPLCDW